MDEVLRRMAKRGLTVHDYNLFDAAAAVRTLATWNICSQVGILEKIGAIFVGPEDLKLLQLNKPIKLVQLSVCPWASSDFRL